MVLAEKILELWFSITNGPTPTVHSAMAQPEGGAYNNVIRGRMEHRRGFF